MNWHYVSAGQSVGPISDTDLEQLVQAGTIQPETLVWNETMTAWQPYAQAKPAMAGQGSALSSAVSGGSTLQACSQCGKVLPPESLISLGGSLVCPSCKPVYIQKMREGLPPSEMGAAMDYAGFWIRVGAKIIDGFVLGIMLVPIIIILFFLGFFGGLLGNARGGFSPAVVMTQVLFQFGSLVISTIYNWFFLAKYGATPGKMLCGLKVVTPTGAPLSSARALGRSAGEILSRIICLIGYIMVAFDSEKRALHDHMAGTRVVRK